MPIGSDIEESLSAEIADLEEENERLGDDLMSMERTVERLGMALSQAREMNAALRNRNAKLSAAAFVRNNNALRDGAELASMRESLSNTKAVAMGVSKKYADALADLSIYESTLGCIAELCMTGTDDLSSQVQQIVQECSGKLDAHFKDEGADPDPDKRFWIDTNPDEKPFRESTVAIVDEDLGGCLAYFCSLEAALECCSMFNKDQEGVSDG